MAVRNTITPLLRRLMADVLTSFQVTLVADPASHTKLAVLAAGRAPMAGPRNFLAPSPQLAHHLAETLKRAAQPFLRAGKSFALAYPAVGLAWRDWIVFRLEHGRGADARPMHALKASTVRRKGHAHIGKDSGDLIDAIRAARVVVRRIK